MPAGGLLVALTATAVGAVLNPAANSVAALVVKLLQDKRKHSKDFQLDIDYIGKELRLMAAAEEDQLSARTMELRDLAHDIQDCLDEILRESECGGSTGEFETRVKELKEKLKKLKDDNNVKGSQSSTMAASSSTSLANMPTTKVPVGIDKAKQELRELLEGQPEELSVISIVGFSGSGKSTLAWAVYCCVDASRFGCRAWVVASDHKDDTKGLLMALLKELRPGHQPSGDVGVQQLQTDITKMLNTNRYLIVFDDIEEEQWDRIKDILPENNGSRIIVTTTIQAVATVCCTHGSNGYVYNMRTLDEGHSKELLQSVLGKTFPGLNEKLTLIVNKCDGHPLALVSVAKYLQRKIEFQEADYKKIWSDLGGMDDMYVFRKLREVLMSNYMSLPRYRVNLKTCLLYICVFPNGHPIRSDRLMRRWSAERYVEDQYPNRALENLEELIDRNIIRAMESSKNAEVRTCRAHGIMHEWMLEMSTSAKFIASLSDPGRRSYRHLFKEGRPSTSSARASHLNHRQSSLAHGGTSGDDKEKLRAHSLTIYGSAGEAVGDFIKCGFLRVLDLEECTDLEDEDIDGIHKLWHLKYLSLGASISRLPGKIKKLLCLETLDMRKTKKVIILPVEVIELPHLAHLLGKFKLGKKGRKKGILKKHLPKTSNLQTLAGFLTDDNCGFPMLMVEMKKLRKVKIWCDSSNKDYPQLSTAIEKFVEHELDTGVGSRSLSLDLGSSSENILRSVNNSLENSFGYLSSLKLHGELYRLTQFATGLCGLTELCLSSTNNLTSYEISKLRMLNLEYLKLVKVNLRGFVIGRGHFERLRRLCLVQCPSLPTIVGDALPNLLSLRLLNQDLHGLSGIEIERHTHLQELALDSQVNQETITSWEDAAKKHPKRPRVLYLKRVETGSMVKYVATERPAPETGSSVVREERQTIPTVQPISDEQPSSARPSSSRASVPARAVDNSCWKGKEKVDAVPEKIDYLHEQGREHTADSTRSAVELEAFRI